MEGHLVEACCVRDTRKICEDNFWKSFYWRDNAGEVDIVIDKRTGLLPVEVKYRNDPKAEMDAFVNKFKLYDVPRLIITKDRLDKQDQNIFAPFWLTR